MFKYSTENYNNNANYDSNCIIKTKCTYGSIVFKYRPSLNLRMVMGRFYL